MNLPLHEESFVPCLFSRGITREIDLQCFHTAKEEPMKGVQPGRSKKTQDLAPRRQESKWKLYEVFENEDLTQRVLPPARPRLLPDKIVLTKPRC